MDEQRVHFTSGHSIDGVSRIHSEIIKSKNDERLYKGVTLSNGLKVLLISDPLTDKAAASLDVNVGSMSDPKPLEGLAHFLEHMLFLGTEKFPDDSDYHNYISQNGGHCNAYTTTTHTNYFFDISASHLEGALDRFVEFFISPLFTESCTERELNAVHSEHEKNLKEDSRRIMQLERATADPDHDYSKFCTGNRETLKANPQSLGIDVRKALLEFHSKWYSANIMCLAVLGKESLEELTEMVVKRFKNVKDHSVTVTRWNDHPIGETQLRKEIKIVPVKDVRKMKISFPIPDLRHHYKSQPEHYVSHLVGHESKGSLLSLLKRNGLCNSLSAGSRYVSGFGFFDITVDLTEKGILHTNDVVTLLFQYLNVIKKHPPQQWIFEELRKINLIKFRFMEKDAPVVAVRQSAVSLQEYPFVDVISARALLEEFRPEVISDLLKMLNADNFRVLIVGKLFDGKTDMHEKWYGSQYKISHFDEDFLQNLRNVGVNEELHLPLPNEFIPTNLELVKREDVEIVPKMVKNSDLSRIWFFQDNKFLVPKAFCGVIFKSPFVSVDPLYSSAMSLFTLLLQDSLNEYSYDAELAGLTYHISTNLHGIDLDVYGYNDNLRVFISKIFEKMCAVDFDKKRFEILKETQFRTYRNFKLSPLRSLLTYYTLLLMSHRSWTIENLLNTEDELTFENFKNIISIVFSKVHFEMFAHGNMSSEEVKQISNDIEQNLKKYFHSKPIAALHALRNREFEIPDCSFYAFETKNDVHEDNAIEVLYQMGPRETDQAVRLELLQQMLSSHCFNKLRTNEQLGYIVGCSVRYRYGVQAMRFLVQSEKHPRYLDSRIENFIMWAQDYLTNMPTEEFEAHKEGLLVKKRDKPKKLLHLSYELFREVESQLYNFDRRNVEISALQRLNKDDVIHFFDQYLNVDAKQRKKLSIRITSDHMKDALSDNYLDSQLSSKPTIIDDIGEFQRHLKLQPLLKPFVDIKTKV